LDKPVGGEAVKVDYVIVGAGFAGCTLSEQIGNQLGGKVLMIERRNHIGGNAYDYYNEDGILVQKYGPHIFHTQNERVWKYLSQFTEWNGYVHRVLAYVRGKEVPLPISIATMEKLCRREFTAEELEEYFERRRVKVPEIRSARDFVVSQVGEELYELFFKNYTKKQWGVDPSELDAEVTQRLPVRMDRDTRYFTDKYQGIPRYGYWRMFERMCSGEKIHLLLNTDYRDVIDDVQFGWLIYTGPIDYYFDYAYGRLPYRSLHFRFETLGQERSQDVAVVNYPNDFEYTRITEFKHLYLQEHRKTAICYEYPASEGPAYYPIPSVANRAMYERYKQEAERFDRVYFVGRLAEYRYMNMDEVVDRALGLFERLKGA
jgi:UDP-galactopyranose mutase